MQVKTIGDILLHNVIDIYGAIRLFRDCEAAAIARPHELPRTKQELILVGKSVCHRRSMPKYHGR